MAKPVRRIPFGENLMVKVVMPMTKVEKPMTKVENLMTTLENLIKNKYKQDMSIGI